MKRRRFLSRTGVVLGSVAVGSASPVRGLAPARISTLFSYHMTGMRPVVQDVAIANGTVFCLYNDFPNQHWGVAATAENGTTVWEARLARGTYFGLGVQRNNVLVHAREYYDTPSHTERNCIVQVDPSGSIQMIQPLGPHFAGRVFITGDSSFLRVDTSMVELWTSSGSTFVRQSTSPVQPFAFRPHVDLLTQSLVALTDRDGSKLRFVSLPSGDVQEAPISMPTVTAAIAGYRKPERPMGSPVVIPATGCDGNGCLLALILPSPVDAVDIVRLDLSGNGSIFAKLTFPPMSSGSIGAPFKLLLFGKDLGLVFADGTVAWYSL